MKRKDAKNSTQINCKGITLIALIITIILMLILAGIVLSLTIGESGIFKTTKYAVQKNSEVTAKEKLELALGNLQANKYTDEAYNENEYVDDYLENEGIKILGNVATVDGWKFEINRNELKLIESLGQANARVVQEVKEYIGKNVNGKYEANILLTIESDKEIESLIIQNPDGTTFEIKPIENKQNIVKDIIVELDEEYRIIVKTANGKTEVIKVEEKSVEKIKTAEELVTFRDKVNTGLTYEGKTIQVVNDIDLSTVCGADIKGEEINWIPIQNFKGIFDGNDNTIKNIYINTNQGNNALFLTNIGTIQNLNVSGTMKTISQYGNHTAGIAVSNIGTIKKCINNVVITSSGPTGGITSNNSGVIMQCANIVQIYAYSGNVGGITGVNTGEIKECYNTGNIIAVADACAGGITGTGAHMTYNCYNRGNISATSAVGGITGVINGAYRPGGVKYTYNSYNTGSLSGNKYVGHITGRDNFGCSSASVNCYTTNATATNLNSGMYSENVWLEDGKKIDNNGNIVDNLNDDRSIKYINDGYPILKWQVQE